MFSWLRHILHGGKSKRLDCAAMHREQESIEIDRLHQSISAFRCEVRRFNEAAAVLTHEIRKVG
jgi:hypothetical protein